MTLDTDYIGQERRKPCDPDQCPVMVGVEKRFTDGTARMLRIEESIESLKTVQSTIERKIDANTAKTEIAAASTTEILDILTLGKSFFRIAGYFGTAVKWGLGIATAIVAFWITLHTGKAP